MFSIKPTEWRTSWQVRLCSSSSNFIWQCH